MVFGGQIQWYLRTNTLTFKANTVLFEDKYSDIWGKCSNICAYMLVFECKYNGIWGKNIDIWGGKYSGIWVPLVLSWENTGVFLANTVVFWQYTVLFGGEYSGIWGVIQ